MKLHSVQRETEAVGIDIQSQFGISSKDAVHIIRILRDKLYSNKPLAIIREYVANAIDAHAEAGKADQPIEVSLPTRLESYLKIRDYGRGLSQSEVLEIYTQYGQSTKRGTNEAIGQLGLGCKSAFAYADNFVVTSWFDGKKSIYNAYLDETDCGTMALMMEIDSDEPSGIEVKVPIKPGDISVFEKAAKETLYLHKIRPKILGVNDFYDSVPKPTIKGEGWDLLSSGQSFAIMGGIPYKIDVSAMDIPTTSVVWKILAHPFAIRFEIGDLEVSASRESLEYKKQTIKAIKKRVEEINSQLLKQIQDDVKDCKTIQEAYVLKDKLTHEPGILNDIVRQNPIVWNGVKIGTNHFSTVLDANKQEEVYCWVFTNSTRRRYSSNTKYTCGQIHHFSLEEHAVFYEIDEKRWRCKLPELETRHKYQHVDMYGYGANRYAGRTYDRLIVYLFNFKDAAEKKAFLKKNDLESLEIIKISTIPAPPKTVTAKAKQQNKKHQVSAFAMDKSQLNNTISGIRSAGWKIEDVDLDAGGVFVDLNRFFVHTAAGVKDWNVIANAFAVLHKHLTPAESKIVEDTPIYGFKFSENEKGERTYKELDATKWIPFSVWILEKLTIAKPLPKLLQEIANDENFRLFEDCYWANLMKHAKTMKFTDPKNVLAELLTEYEAMKKIKDRVGKNEELFKVYEAFSAFLDDDRYKGFAQHNKKLDPSKTATPTFDFRVKFKAVLDRYPMVDFVDLDNKASRWYYRDQNFPDKEQSKKIVDYVNLIDA